MIFLSAVSWAAGVTLCSGSAPAMVLSGNSAVDKKAEMTKCTYFRLNRVENCGTDTACLEGKKGKKYRL